MDLTALTEEEVLALLDDPATSDETIEQLAAHHLDHTASSRASVPAPIQLDALADELGASSDLLMERVSLATSDQLAILDGVSLGTLTADTTLSATNASVVKALFDDIPNNTDAYSGLFGKFNQTATRRRLRKFNRRINDSSFGGKVLFAEGDSWFQYPWVKKDIIDWLNDRESKYAIRCVSYGGDWLAQMVSTFDSTLDTMASAQAQALLLSGGGNDLMGRPGLQYLVRSYKPGKPASYYLGQYAENRLLQMKQMYQELFSRTHTRFPGLPILCHGYARPFPGKGSWIKDPLASVGITDEKLQRGIVRLMIDRFNDMLETLTASHPDVHYIDCRAFVTTRSHWYNELHPTDARWEKIADEFEKVLDSVL